MSLAAVHCWDWPDLCKQENVSSYPMVHLYHVPTAATPTPPNKHLTLTYTCKPLQGALDSRNLLKAVGIGEEMEEDEGKITLVRISIHTVVRYLL